MGRSRAVSSVGVVGGVGVESEGWEGWEDWRTGVDVPSWFAELTKTQGQLAGRSYS